MPTMATPWKHPSSGIYYLRVSVPEDLRTTIGKREIKQSLKTRNFSEARVLFASEYASVQQLFEQHRQKAVVTPRDVQILADRWLKDSVEELEATGNFDDYLRIFLGSDASAEADTDYLQEALEAGYQHQVVITGEIANRLIESNGLFIVKGSELYQQLVTKLCWRLLDLHHVAEQRHLGDWKPVDASSVRMAEEPLQTEQGAPVRSRITNYKPLGEIVDSFIDYKIGRGDWTAKTEQDNRVILGLFIDTYGVKADPNAITREQFREFAKLLGRIPQRYNINKAFKGLGLRQIIKLGEEMGMPVLSPATVKKKFVFIKSLFKFASLEEWVDKNRAEGISIKVDAESKSKRLPFTHSELNQIFKHLQGTQRPSDYWLPRIALTTGMRGNEILQLHVEDVKLYGGVWYFDINKGLDVDSGKAKKAKTENSIRKVPVPQVLIDAGLLDFVSQQKAGRLFSCVKLGSDGTYTKLYGRRFNRVLDHLGIKPAKGSGEMKDFHSFRHNFRANAREYGVSKELVDLLGGWKADENGSAGDEYGREFTAFLGRLKACVDQIEYEGVPI